jgi:hypothetical protein
MKRQTGLSNSVKSFLSDLIWALGWTTVFGLGSWLVTIWLFDDLYYLSALLPLVMMLFLMAGWFSYLRYDGMNSKVFLKTQSAKVESPKETLKTQGPIIAEFSEKQGIQQSPSQTSGTRILLLTGILLGLLATCLYHLFDIGARLPG